jgi:hypothetical protein
MIYIQFILFSSRFIIFAMLMANKTLFTAAMARFSMSTWALVTILELFIVREAKDMLDLLNRPTMNRLIITPNQRTTIRNPRTTNPNLHTMFNPIMNLLMVMVAAAVDSVSPKASAAGSKVENISVSAILPPPR